MFPRNLTAAQAYSSVGIASGSMSASPHGLILMLYDGAMLAVAAARMHMQLNQKVEKSKAISHAVAIICDGLMASLDLNAGGEIAASLMSLYQYMVERLTEANMHNHPQPLEEVGRLLAELNEAWQAIGKKSQTRTAVTAGGE
jgi:flagellar protein FliS